MNNVTIDPTTTCLNEVQLTQLVEQYCLACTTILDPPPPAVSIPVSDDDSGQTTTVDVTTVIYQPLPAATQPVRAFAYCLPHPVRYADGVLSSLVYLHVGQRLTRSQEGAFRATYRRGIGMTCPHLANAVLDSSPVPMFTLTVPAGFENRLVRLCVESKSASGPTVCHDVPILGGATVEVPMSTDVTAHLLKTPARSIPPPKSKKQISAASSAFLLTAGSGSTKSGNVHGKRSDGSRHGQR